MKRASLLTLILAALSLVFGVILVFMRMKFPLYPLVSYQDVLSILPPLLFIPIYWLMFRQAGARTSSGQEIAFMVLAALWVQGQGMHLSANAIDNLIESLARSQVLNITASDIYHLTYFFDEHLSHFMMHTGMLGLAALLIYREWRDPADAVTAWGMVVPASLMFGFFNFCTFIEGQTVVLGLPGSLLVVSFAAIWGRKRLAHRPLLAFFFITFLLAFLLLAGWGLYWGGFPEFSQTGWI
jgi:hypothetical protein